MHGALHLGAELQVLRFSTLPSPCKGTSSQSIYWSFLSWETQDRIPRLVNLSEIQVKSSMQYLSVLYRVGSIGEVFIKHSLFVHRIYVSLVEVDEEDNIIPEARHSCHSREFKLSNIQPQQHNWWCLRRLSTPLCIVGILMMKEKRSSLATLPEGKLVASCKNHGADLGRFCCVLPVCFLRSA